MNDPLSLHFKLIQPEPSHIIKATGFIEAAATYKLIKFTWQFKLWYFLKLIICSKCSLLYAYVSSHQDLTDC
jgi:hypothetical protein